MKTKTPTYQSSVKFLLLLVFLVTGKATVFSQYKRFSVDSKVSFGRTDKNTAISYFGYSVRMQYNFPKVFSVNIGYGQEHQSFSNRSFNDIPSVYYKYSDIRTSEQFLPLAFRATFGRKFMIYVEAGAIYHFKRVAHWDGTVDYSSSSSYEDYTFSYDEEMKPPPWSSSNNMLNNLHFFYGCGVTLPVYSGFSIFGEVHNQLLGQNLDEYGTEDHLASHEIVPYSRLKFSLGLSYYFNWKKDSEFKFNTVYFQSHKKAAE